ncbi:MAG TPA: hypothetical protein VK927_03270, partial [Adhaeribacter sp.]|nr:hypothetical protein [Adhaeribacter sp.]
MKPYRFKALLFVLLSFIGFNAYAQTSPDWVWAKHDSLGYEPKSMAIDGSGNIYVAYQYTFTKYNAAGNLQWRLPLGNQFVKLTGVATDPIGNIYLSGYFWGTALIDTV